MFAWGCGPCLGTGSVDATSARPRLIDELQSTCVIDIAVGDSHCLALSKGWCSFSICVYSTRPLRLPCLNAYACLLVLTHISNVSSKFAIKKLFFICMFVPKWHCMLHQ